ncbi:MAG TPA: hypothetical protein VMO26_00995 [Vicinamibacterales bacterium]|nr:hypothetical protein [Vicinamibacterales bacterium]
MMKMVARPHRTLLAGLFVGMVVMGTAAVTLASEHVINIPALSLLPANSTVTYERNAFGWGNLTEADGLFYAPVIFPRMQRSICCRSMYATWTHWTSPSGS